MAYETINHANIYYQMQGYNRVVEVPWLVDEEISNITKPVDKRNHFIDGKVIVASGEQSFLQMIMNGRLEPKNSYFTTTPCFRCDDTEDDQHKKYFMKTELIYFEMFDGSQEQKSRFNLEFTRIVSVCKGFYNKYLPTKCIQFVDDSYTHYSLIDIVSEMDDIELGSYGIRQWKDIIWIYGTGCAEPRLTYAVNKVMKPGYHLSLIPKTTVIHSVDKIIEEYEEFIDSIRQGTSLMEIVELSDLIGAIDMYISKKYNLTLDDLIIFNNITRRSFINKRRT